MQASLHIDARHELAEGPVWHNNTLYWVNITEGRLYRHDAETDTLSHFDLESSALGVALPAKDDWWWTARERDCAWLHEPTGRIVPMEHPIPDLPPAHRFNDGYTGPDGHPWVGSAALADTRETASLYRSDDSGALHVALPGITLSNGLGWSPDNTRFYYVDSLAHPSDQQSPNPARVPARWQCSGRSQHRRRWTRLARHLGRFGRVTDSWENR